MTVRDEWRLTPFGLTFVLFLFVYLLCSCFNIPLIAGDQLAEVLFAYPTKLTEHYIKETRIFSLRTSLACPGRLPTRSGPSLGRRGPPQTCARGPSVRDVALQASGA